MSHSEIQIADLSILASDTVVGGITIVTMFGGRGRCQDVRGGIMSPIGDVLSRCMWD